MNNISEFFLSENFQFLKVKFFIYLNRFVFVVRENYLLAFLLSEAKMIIVMIIMIMIIISLFFEGNMQ